MVEVVWDDAAAHTTSWTDTFTVQPALVLSVGFLVFSSKEHIVIAQDIDHEGQSNGRSQIPKGMVKSMTVLRKKNA